MTNELVHRNYSEGTARAYLRSVKEFARYFNRPPDQLGPEHIREYAAYLFEARQLSSSSSVPVWSKCRNGFCPKRLPALREIREMI
jgi:hypothetical protein